jgi:photosystem II stability/assembly factor-like uncharacterized protein
LSRLSFLFPAVLVLGLYSVSSADWESVGPEGGEVRHVLQSTQDSNTLFAFTGSGPIQVLKSTNGGDTWTKVGLCNGYDYSAAMGPTGTIYIGSSSYVYYSTNGGVSWTMGGAVSNNIFWGLATHPTDPNILYGVGYRYNSSTWVLCALKSTNGGASWTYQDLNSVMTYATDIDVSKTNPNLVFLTAYEYTGSTYNPLLYRSTDAGTTWTNVTPAAAASDYYGQSVAVSPVDANLVLFGTLYGMYRSTDGGTTWTKVSTSNYFYGTAFSPANPNYVYAGGSSCFLRSTNAGLTWSSSSTGLPSSTFQAVAPALATATTVYTSCALGFYRSTDAGASWTLDDDGMIIGRILAFGSAPSQPSKMYMQMMGLGVWLTTNNGTSWTHLTTPLACGDFCSIVVRPTDPNYILALEGSG